MYTHGMWKDSTDEPICRAAQTYGCGGRKEREGYMERVTWKHTLSYVKLTANGNLPYNSGSSNGAQ